MTKGTGGQRKTSGACRPPSSVTSAASSRSSPSPARHARRGDRARRSLRRRELPQRTQGAPRTKTESRFSMGTHFGCQKWASRQQVGQDGRRLFP